MHVSVCVCLWHISDIHFTCNAIAMHQFGRSDASVRFAHTVRIHCQRGSYTQVEMPTVVWRTQLKPPPSPPSTTTTTTTSTTISPFTFGCIRNVHYFIIDMCNMRVNGDVNLSTRCHSLAHIAQIERRSTPFPPPFLPRIHPLPTPNPPRAFHYISYGHMASSVGWKKIALITHRCGALAISDRPFAHISFYAPIGGG